MVCVLFAFAMYMFDMVLPTMHRAKGDLQMVDHPNNTLRSRLGLGLCEMRLVLQLATRIVS